MANTAISLQEINKKYRTGFLGRKVVALKDLSLEIEQGEILGYLGPNGSGKTTTFKVILGLIRPDSGTISINGRQGDENMRKEIGYLPENPYFYMYLTAKECLHFAGQLKGMSKSERDKRIDELLPLVGLEHAADKQLRKFSRGMLQRIGVAQAMVNNPDILILDEPMNGLDPAGRKSMRDIILGYRDKGKSVIFSSHIISDVEIMCDRAAVIKNGVLQGVVQVDEILSSQVQYWELSCSGLSVDQVRKFSERAIGITETREQVLFKIEKEEVAKKMFNEIEAAGGKVTSLSPQRKGLEESYLNLEN